MEENTEHKRRIHYSGKYPKKFEEKYKEHAPEKYAETVAHVVEKGSTPAGMHIPICVGEIMEILDIKPGERGLDCTLGYGGHSTEMLKCLQGKGHLTSLDVDPIESEKTEKRLREKGFGEEIFTVRHMNFADIDKVAETDGPFDFVLADLGVSSMQIDDPERGFSYKLSGPLDLRMDPTKGESAAMRLRTMTKDEIASMLSENADEPYAEEIASAIIKTYKKGGTIERTEDLKKVIEGALWKVPKTEQKEAVKKSCQRTFQALRIDVNNEFEALYEMLSKLPGVLAPGGRAAILTFHSGEDRLVKKAFKEAKADGAFTEIAEDIIRPSAEECRRNPRATCAKLRWARR